jgi:hypothetical protein
MDKKSTGYYDKNGELIYDGDKLVGKTFDGNEATFIVRWSDYHHSFIGDCPDEIYDVSPSIFHQYERNKIIL